MLKAKGGIIRRPARPFNSDKMENLMYVCVILHNMILKDKEKALSPIHIHDPPTKENNDEDNSHRMKDNHTYHRLRYNIVEYIHHHREQKSVNYIDLKDV